MESFGVWPEKCCCGSYVAEGRVAGRCFTSAVPATGATDTAANDAGRKHGGNRGGVPTGDTSKAGRDGSITVTGNGPTGNVAACGA